jgi:trans-aconitate 2-methyltransferase
MPWDPNQYLKFSDERLRPGFELMARIGELPRGEVWDLGCGTGDHVRAMAERWADRAVFGYDLSSEMLAKANSVPSRVDWRQGAVDDWRPDAPAALVFSNALLQWVDHHKRLFPRLLASLASGGVLAIQMPRNFDAPSHVLMRRTAAEGRWAAKLNPLLREDPVGDPGFYYDLLAPCARGGIDIWETEYLHLMREGSGESPVLAWVKGTAVRPLLAALEEGEQRDFLAAYDAALRTAYPKRADGVTLFPFRRIFIVARA